MSLSPNGNWDNWVRSDTSNNADLLVFPEQLVLLVTCTRPAVILFVLILTFVILEFILELNWIELNWIELPVGRVLISVTFRNGWSRQYVAGIIMNYDSDEFS
jgi:hypothetical protein